MKFRQSQIMRDIRKPVPEDTPDTSVSIEISEQEKNIIRFCVEESYKRDIERGEHEIRAEITKRILDKLVAIKKKEEALGTFTKSYFF